MHDLDLARVPFAGTPFAPVAKPHSRLAQPLASALLYDAVYEGRGADVAVYLGLAMASYGSVLELGTGTGRLLIPLLSRGIDAWGLELDSEMLKASRERLLQMGGKPNRSRIARGDMRDFSLPRRFSLVLLACNTLSLMLEDQEVLDVLSCVRKHLEGEGALVFDVSVVEGHSWYRPPYTWQGQAEAVWIGGVAALATEAGSFDLKTQLCTVRRQFVLVDGRHAETTTITRQRSIAHLRRLLTDAGFCVPDKAIVDERGAPLSGSSSVAYVRASPGLGLY